MVLLGAGCQRMENGGAAGNSVRVVDRIEVRWEGEEKPFNRIYTNPEKMQAILNGIRRIGQKSSAKTDPETLKNEQYTITLIYSDESTYCYQTKSDRYICCGQEPWQQTNPDRIAELHQLLRALPADR